MQKELILVLNPKQASDAEVYQSIAATQLKIALKRITHIQVIGRSIDARQRSVKVNLKLHVFIDEHPPIEE